MGREHWRTRCNSCTGPVESNRKGQRILGNDSKREAHLERMHAAAASRMLAVVMLTIPTPGSPWQLGCRAFSGFSEGHTSPMLAHGRVRRVCMPLFGGLKSSAGEQPMMTISHAERTLKTFDTEQQRIAREGFENVREGFGGGTSAAKWAASHPDWPALRSAVLALAHVSEKVICAVKQRCMELCCCRHALQCCDDDPLPV